MREKIRDKTRDELADHLNSIGVEASLSERKRPEESIGNKWWRRSLGVIDIATGPISFINVVKKDRSKNEKIQLIDFSDCKKDDKSKRGVIQIANEEINT